MVVERVFILANQAGGRKLPIVAFWGGGWKGEGGRRNTTWIEQIIEVFADFRAGRIRVFLPHPRYPRSILAR